IAGGDAELAGLPVGAERIDAKDLAVDVGEVLSVAGVVGVSVGGAVEGSVEVISAAPVADTDVEQPVVVEAQAPAVVIGLRLDDAEEDARGGAGGVAGDRGGGPFADDVAIGAAGCAEFRMSEAAIADRSGGFAGVGIEHSAAR